MAVKPIDLPAGAITRRHLLQIAGATGGALAVASVAGLVPAEAAGPSFLTTTDLNLRAKPRSYARVLRVIPANSIVTLTPGGSGAYLKVSYDGTRGYAHGNYLVATLGNPGSTDEAVPATTTAAVSHRAEASTASAIYAVIPSGTKLGVGGGTEHLQDLASRRHDMREEYAVLRMPGDDRYRHPELANGAERSVAGRHEEQTR